MHTQVIKISTEILDFIEYEYLDNERQEYKQLKLNEFKTKLENAINRVGVATYQIEWR